MYVLSRPVLLGLQLLGLLPVSVDHLPLRGDVARLSWPRVAYSVIMAVVNCALCCFWIRQIMGDELTGLENFKTFKITNFCSTSSTFLGAVVAFGNAITSAKQKILMVEKLRETDFLLQHKPGPPRVRRASLLVLGGILVFASIETVNFMIFHYKLNTSYINFTWLTLQYARAVILFSLVEVMEVVLTMRERFELVNERVIKVVDRSRSEHLMWTVALPCVETFTMPQESKMSITVLSEIHWSLCCVVYDINNIYGCFLVTVMMFLFAQLVFYPYLAFILFGKSLMSLINVAFSIAWLLIFVVELYIIVLPCSLAAKEAKKTVMIVTKLMGNKIAKPFFSELEMFADQLFHRDVEFTACGLITLHTSIIVSVASAVTTYLAIIIQFQTEDNVEDRMKIGIAVVNNSSLHK